MMIDPRPLLTATLLAMPIAAEAEAPVPVPAYRAEAVRVYDGDSIWANIHLGLGIWLHGQPIRLAYIDAPELHGDARPAGLAARDRLAGLIAGCPLVVEAVPGLRDKYGRLVAVLWCGQTNVNDRLLEEGHGREIGR